MASMLPIGAGDVKTPEKAPEKALMLKYLSLMMGANQ
jgi:hypothetical protein